VSRDGECCSQTRCGRSPARHGVGDASRLSRGPHVASNAIAGWDYSAMLIGPSKSQLLHLEMERIRSRRLGAPAFTGYLLRARHNERAGAARR
jgi:hypothetical protein